MPRISLINFTIGFWTLFIAAASGAFIATDLTATYIAEKAINPTWGSVLLSSAHGHTNLFGLLHIVFGLTLPYSRLSRRWQFLQTVGLSCGVLAMGPGMYLRSLIAPTADGTDIIGVAIGLLLSAALASLFAHAVVLSARCMARD